MATKKSEFISPPSCEQCPDAPSGTHCYSKFNCSLYGGRIDLPIDRIAESLAAYDPRSEWDRDVEELKRLIEAGS